jgi:hypothetical protein
MHCLDRIILGLIEPTNDFKSVLLSHGIYNLFQCECFCPDLTDFVPGKVQGAVHDHENDVANFDLFVLRQLPFFVLLLFQGPNSLLKLIG